MDNEGKNSHFFEGLLFGGILGAAAGMLFAPFAGDKTRENLRAKLKEMDLDDVIEKLAEAFEEGKKEAAKVEKELE